MKKSLLLCVLPLMLAACGGGTNADGTPQAPTGMETAGSAMAGAAAGSLLGNLLSGRNRGVASAPAPVQHTTINRTVIQKNYIVKPPAPTTSPRFSAPRPSSNFRRR